MTVLCRGPCAHKLAFEFLPCSIIGCASSLSPQDINFFNPNNHALAVTRISAELPVTGGLYTSCSSYIVTFERLYQPWENKTRFIIELATLGLFVFYLFNEVKLIFIGEMQCRFLDKDGKFRPTIMFCTACGGCDDPHKKKRDGSATEEGDSGKEDNSGDDHDEEGDQLERGEHAPSGKRKLRGRMDGRLSRADMAYDTARRSHLSVRRGLRRVVLFMMFQGRRVCQITFWHWLRLVNLFSFVAMLFYRYRAMQRLPADIKVDSDSYSPAFRAAAIDLVMSNNIQVRSLLQKGHAAPLFLFLPTLTCNLSTLFSFPRGRPSTSFSSSRSCLRC